jgi:ribosomal protein S18 acetylase RimI-like enzyme
MAGYLPLRSFPKRLSSAMRPGVRFSPQATPMQFALAWLRRRSPNILLIPGTSFGSAMPPTGLATEFVGAFRNVPRAHRRFRLSPPGRVSDSVRLLSITLQDVRPDDETALFELYVAVRSEELGMGAWPDEMRDRVLRTQFDAQRRGYRDQYPGLDEQLIMSGGSPVGWVIVDRSGNRELHGLDIALLAEARQQGVGTRVMRLLQEEAAAGNKPMVIVVERRNARALAFHGRLGFTAINDTDVHCVMEWRQDRQA